MKRLVERLRTGMMPPASVSPAMPPFSNILLSCFRKSPRRGFSPLTVLIVRHS
jgi:hypothetical protein